MDSLRRNRASQFVLAPPKVEVGYDPSRVRGNPDAPVTIVGFPITSAPFAVARKKSSRPYSPKYGDKVKLAYRDFPLRQIHPHSLAASEASRCASEQGKFWHTTTFCFQFPTSSMLRFARSCPGHRTQRSAIPVLFEHRKVQVCG